MKNFINISDCSSEELRAIIEEAKRENKIDLVLINLHLMKISPLKVSRWL